MIETIWRCEHERGCSRGGRAGLHPRHRPRRPGGGPARCRRHALSARAERLPAHRPRQVDLPEFRRRAGVRRPLQPALRRHQSGQGGAGVHRGDRGGRALARLRLGRASPLRLGLFRAALRVGRGPDPQGQGLCRRPLARRDARLSRHADRARPQQPLARAPGRGEPRSVRAHARRRVPRRRPRAAGQDRHGRPATSICAIRCSTASCTPRIRAPAMPGRSTRPTTSRTASRMRSRA